MKICFLLCGLPRSYDIVIQNIKNKFFGYDMDLYISTSSTKDYYDNEFINDNNIFDIINDDNNIINIILSRDKDNNEYRNSLNYIKKISIGLKIIDNNYDLYVVLRSDFYIENINFLCDINNDDIYFSKICKNKFSKSVDGRVNDNIIVTKNFKKLIKFYDFYDYAKNRDNNYCDIILYNFLNDNNICYSLIEIEYKLLLSNCNLIAISGDSGSGKTTISNKILNLFNKDKVLKFETDRYHEWERGNENYKNYTHLNPYSNKLELMSDDIYNLKLGNEIYQVDYDHLTGKFTKEEKIESKQNIIICGLHTLYLEDLNKIIDIKIFMDTDRELIKEWKINRDIIERKHSKEYILKQMEIRNADYEMYIKSQKDNSDIIIHFYKDVSGELQCYLTINKKIIFDKLYKYFVDYSYDFNIIDDKKCIVGLKKNISEIYEKEDMNKYFSLNNEEELNNMFYDQIIMLIAIYIYKK